VPSRAWRIMKGKKKKKKMFLSFFSPETNLTRASTLAPPSPRDFFNSTRALPLLVLNQQ